MPLDPKSHTKSFIESSGEHYTQLYGDMNYDTLRLFESVDDYTEGSTLDYVTDLDEEDLVDWLKDLGEPFQVHARLVMRETEQGDEELFVKFQVEGPDHNRGYGASFNVRCDGNDGITSFLKFQPPVLADGETLTATPVQIVGMLPENTQAHLFHVSEPFTYTDDYGSDTEHNHLFAWSEGGWIRVFPSTEDCLYNPGNQLVVTSGGGNIVEAFSNHHIVVNGPLIPPAPVPTGTVTFVGKSGGLNIKNAPELFEVTPAIPMRTMAGLNYCAYVGAYHDDESKFVKLLPHKSKAQVQSFDPLVTMKYVNGDTKDAFASIGYTLTGDMPEKYTAQATYVRTLFGLKKQAVAKVYAVDNASIKFVTITQVDEAYRAYASSEDGSSGYHQGQYVWNATSHKDAMERLGYTLTEPENAAEEFTATFVEQKEISSTVDPNSFRFLYKLSHGVFASEPTSILHHMVVWVTPMNDEIRTGVYMTDSDGNPPDWNTTFKHKELVLHDEALAKLGITAHGTPKIDIKVPVKEAKFVRKYAADSKATSFIYHITPSFKLGSFGSHTNHVAVQHTVKPTSSLIVTYIYPCNSKGELESMKPLWSWFAEHLDPIYALKSWGNYDVVGEDAEEAATDGVKTAKLVHTDIVGTHTYQLTPPLMNYNGDKIKCVSTFHFNKFTPKTQVWGVKEAGGSNYQTTGSDAVWESEADLTDKETLAAMGYILVNEAPDVSVAVVDTEELPTATLVRLEGMTHTFFLSKPYTYGPHKHTTDYVKVLCPPVGAENENITVLPCTIYSTVLSYLSSVHSPEYQGVVGALAKIGYTWDGEAMSAEHWHTKDDYSIYTVTPQYAYYVEDVNEYRLTAYLRVETTKESPWSTAVYPCSSSGNRLSDKPAWRKEDGFCTDAFALSEMGYYTVS